MSVIQPQHYFKYHNSNQMMKKKMYTSTMWLLLLLSLVIGSSSTIHRQRMNNGPNTFMEKPSKGPATGAAATAAAAAGSPSSSYNPIGANKWTKPFFDISVPNNVTALVGKSAYLTCRVRNLGNYTVSWIRHSDLLILTVTTYTFTTDQRFQTTYHRDTNEWTLHIKWVQDRDAGMYECQISTQPIMSYFVHLNTVDLSNEHLFRAYNDQQSDDNDDNNISNRVGIGVGMANNMANINIGDDSNLSESFMGVKEQPTAKILGERDQYVNRGSFINLTCVIGIDPEEPRFILWYHESKAEGEHLMIGIDPNKDEVILNARTDDITTSYLIIQKADVSDTGKYTCAPSNSAPTSINVHVLHGERTGAMQTSTTTSLQHVSHTMCLPLAVASALLNCVDSDLSRILALVWRHINGIASLGNDGMSWVLNKKFTMALILR